MISVQSLRLRLNGNSVLLFLILCLFVQCKTIQHTTKGSTIPDSDRPTRPKVDTVSWNEPDEEDKLAINPEIEDIDATNTSNTNLNASKLGLILPLNASSMNFQSNRISSRDNAMMHYYHGIILGLKQLEEKGMDLEVFIEDSKEDQSKLNAILEEFKQQEVKYIFGGKGKNHVEGIASFAKEHDMYYMSGWQANSKFVGENDHYFQLNPGFQAHALAILRHALAEFRPDQIILFGSKREESRLGEINRLYTEYTKSEEALETFVVENMEALEELEMLEWQEDEERKVFIAPITRDFNLIHDFFRFLDFNELHEKSIVYGMTEWNSQKLFNHLNNFDVRLTALWNPDIAANYSDFEESFYNKLGTFPQSKAYEGYGHVMIMGDFMSKSENGKKVGSTEYVGHGMKAEFVDHNNLEFPSTDREQKKTYYENSQVHLLGFKNFRYHILH